MGVGADHSNPTLIQNFIFMGSFGYIGQIWDTLPYTSLQQVHFTVPVNVYKIAG